MYIIFPIVIFVVALSGIWVIISRKFIYLKKLTPEAISNPPPTMMTFWSAFFPEVISFFGKIQWREYRVRFTAESEKMLRRLRLIFLKIDDLTHRLIRRLRRSVQKHEEILEKQEEVKIEKEQVVAIATRDPKEEEQHLIMEIGKNPKEPALYQKLGDIYLKTGETDNARMSFKTVLDLDPENWYAKMKIEELGESLPS